VIRDALSIGMAAAALALAIDGRRPAPPPVAPPPWPAAAPPPWPAVAPPPVAPPPVAPPPWPAVAPSPGPVRRAMAAVVDTVDGFIVRR
jgi:hypothetical protein